MSGGKEGEKDNTYRNLSFTPDSHSNEEQKDEDSGEEDSVSEGFDEPEKDDKTLDDLLDDDVKKLEEAESEELARLYQLAKTTEIKKQILTILGEKEKGGTNVIETIVGAIEEDNSEVKERALKALEKVEIDMSSIPVLLGAFEGDGSDTDVHIQDALARVGEKPAVELTKFAASTEDSDLYRKAIKLASEMGEKDVGGLVKLLVKGYEETATRVLKQVESDEKLELLIGLTEESEGPETKKRAVYLLGESQDSRVVSHLADLLKYDSDISVRIEAVNALGMINTETADEVLEETVEDVSMNNRVRMAAKNMIG